MSKPRRVYVCQACGQQAPKWLGRCPGCDAWSSMVEEQTTPASAKQAPARSAGPQALSQVVLDHEARRPTGLDELDRVLGGGLVHGALILVGGDPGIGKSTILLQAAGRVAKANHRVLYITAEESAAQVKLRADRLGITSDHLYLLPETNLDAALRVQAELDAKLLIVDSVQTVGDGTLESPIGSVSQIRGVTHRLMEVAKGKGITTFVVGHVTKEGAIAGPKVMEHMVDTVLYFEGERTGPYRILRSHKNRFGSAQEIGIFEMHADGLRPVNNASELFLSQRAKGPGSVVVTSVEGSRPLLLEVQALATPTLYGTPRRTTIGFDPQRVAMLCAVLDRHAELGLNAQDVYVNVAGGVRLQEPAADLGVMLALASATRQRAIADDLVVAGEVGLSGEVRAVTQLAARIAEAQALGFGRAIVPHVDVERWRGAAPALPLHGAQTVAEALVEAGLS